MPWGFAPGQSALSRIALHPIIPRMSMPVRNNIQIAPLRLPRELHEVLMSEAEEADLPLARLIRRILIAHSVPRVVAREATHGAVQG